MEITILSFSFLAVISTTWFIIDASKAFLSKLSITLLKRILDVIIVSNREMND